MEDIVLQLLDKGAVVALAAFTILTLRREYDRHAEELKELKADNAAREDALREALIQNAAVIGENTAVIRRNIQASQELQVTLRKLNGKQ